MANDDVAFQNQSGCGPRLRRFGRALCNTEKGEFLNRTPASWVKITIFYIIFYACLAGFFALMLAGFFQSIDPKFPTQRKMESLLKGNPGMGYRPFVDLDSNLIKFKANDPKSYELLVKDLDNFMIEYNKKQNGTVMKCDENSTAGEENVCEVADENSFGPCVNQTSFGYMNGTPCVLLKINKIYDWMPEAFGNVTDDDSEDVKNRREDALKRLGTLPTDKIGITCQGDNNADDDMLQNIDFYPNGFPFSYFPYMNQPGYRTPIVFAHFTKFTHGVVIQVWCKMWAKNIKHHKNDKAGSVRFELFVE